MFQGHSDTELSADGLRQAEKIRDRLAGEKIDIIYSSDLKRAVVTAETIASRHGLSITTCSELREINYGKVEKLTIDEIKNLYPKLAEMCVDWSSQLQFPGGESVVELQQRVNKFLDRLNQHSPEQTILIVAHGGPLRVMVCALLGIGLEHWRQIYIDLASLSIVQIYPEVTMLVLLNDTSHLK
jgi:alpha-ribazole phosphatase